MMRSLLNLAGALGLVALGTATTASAVTIDSLVGDKDGFGITGAPAVPPDLSSFTGLGGTIGVDNRDPGDLSTAPFTDIWGFQQTNLPSPIDYVHAYSLVGTPISATLFIQEAGMSDDRGPWAVFFNGVNLGQIGVFSLADDVTIRLLSFGVPTALLTGSDTVSLVYQTPAIEEGFAINFSELVVEATAVPEPTTVTLLCAGLLGLAALRRRSA